MLDFRGFLETVAYLNQTGDLYADDSKNHWNRGDSDV
jgi:hypothetical protein